MQTALSRPETRVAAVTYDAMTDFLTLGESATLPTIEQTITALEASIKLSRIRRDFHFVTRICAEEGVAVSPEVIKEYIAQEREAKAAFDRAACACGAAQ